jgi:opacity protein-like surface antigen
VLAEAEDPLGLYVGAGAGQATVRADQLQFVNVLGQQQGGAGSISKTDTGWKIMLGVRPISLLGAELEYIDFGHTSKTTTGFGLGYQADLRATAPSAFCVLYAPIPVPAFNLYGKVGMSNLHGSVNAQGHITCPMCIPVPIDLHRDRTDMGLAYGAGLQLKLARLAVRAEYERISASTGDPSLMSLGLIWTFY